MSLYEKIMETNYGSLKVQDVQRRSGIRTGCDILFKIMTEWNFFRRDFPKRVYQYNQSGIITYR